MEIELENCKVLQFNSLFTAKREQKWWEIFAYVDVISRKKKKGKKGGGRIFYSHILLSMLGRIRINGKK